MTDQTSQAAQDVIEQAKRAIEEYTDLLPNDVVGLAEYLRDEGVLRVASDYAMAITKILELQARINNTLARLDDYDRVGAGAIVVSMVRDALASPAPSQPEPVRPMPGDELHLQYHPIGNRATPALVSVLVDDRGYYSGREAVEDGTAHIVEVIRKDADRD